MKKLIHVLLLIQFGVAGVRHAEAQADVMVSRYTTVDMSIEEVKKDPLKEILQDFTLPSRLATIGQAIEYVLLDTGYKLRRPYDANPASYLLYQMKLPLTQRHFNDASFQQILNTLVPEGYELKVNPVHRQLDIGVSDNYKQYLLAGAVNNAKSQFDGDLLATAARNDLADLRLTAPTPESKPSLGALNDVPKPRHSSGSGLTRYGPVVSGEYLSTIIAKLELNGISNEQAWVALFNANDHAFINHNMNNLRAGVMLEIPSPEEMMSISDNEAVLVVAAHQSGWKDGGQAK